MKNLKGGYKIIDLQHNDLTSGFSIEGIYDCIEGSYLKTLLITGITISGVEKNDVYVTPVVSGSNYVITVYNKTLTIKSTDAITVADAEVYKSNEHIFIYNDNWGISSSGTLNETRMNLIKNIPNLAIKVASDGLSSIAGLIFYPCGYTTLDSHSYYEYYAIKQDSTAIQIALLRVNKTSGAYTVTIKTIS